MNIAHYIKTLLFEQNCVIIPDFGGFIANYISADIHPIRHTFIPPSKHIAFNEMLKVNDGLLVSLVANTESISREEAMIAIREFVDKIRQDIRMTGKFRFEQIGTLYLNHEQKLQFEPENTINYLTASFGLPDLQFTPIERQTAARPTAKDRATLSATQFSTTEKIISPVSLPDAEKKRPAFQSALVPAALFLAIAFGYFWFLDKGDNLLSKINPFALANDNFFAEKRNTDPKPEKKSDNASILPEQNEWGKNNRNPDTAENAKKIAILTEEVPPVPEKEKKDVPKTEPKKAEPEPKKPAPEPAKARYFIIVGGFGSISNAEKLKNELTQEGHAAKVLSAGSNGLIKVSFEDFSTEQEANAVTRSLKSRYPGAWVFKN